jgi:hypothetical protein
MTMASLAAPALRSRTTTAGGLLRTWRISKTGIPMAAVHKTWMMFIDGENLTIRAQAIAEKDAIDLMDKAYFDFFRKDTYFWPTDLQGHWWAPSPKRVNILVTPERRWYYTSAQGDESTQEQVHDELSAAEFAPVVIRKRANQRKSKGVDIALTKDMLVQAFLNNYDVAVLVAGDGDYVPVVEEVKRLGKWVIVAFFDEESGLSPRLRRAADHSAIFNLVNGSKAKGPRRLELPPSKAQSSIHVDSALKSRLEQIAQSRSPPRKITEEADIAITRYVEQEEQKGSVATCNPETGL